MKPGFAVLALIAALMLSGCQGSANEAESVDGPVSWDGSQDAKTGPDAGAIEGFVVDDSELPLEGVEVALSEFGLTTRTDDVGRFGFSNVRAGQVVVVAAMPGYEGAVHAVEVVAGQIMNLRLRLISLPSDEPYTSTLTETGMMGCSILLKRSPGPQDSHNLIAACGATVLVGLELQNLDKFSVRFPIGNLNATAGAWSETVWVPNQALAGREMRVSWWLPDSAALEGVRMFMAWAGPTPLGIRIPTEPIFEMLANVTTIEDCTPDDCTLVSAHHGRATTLGSQYPVDAGVAFQQRFEEYLTLFYNQPLPETFTLFGDA